MNLSVITLAAGQGKRMASAMPKVLHQIGGRALLAHVIATAQALEANQHIVVYGHGGATVSQAFADYAYLDWVEQAEQLGTGHAVAQALPRVQEADSVLILYGDVPLIRATTLQPLLASAANGQVGLLTALANDPSGYGRIVRDGNHQVRRIVEHKDASADEQQIQEINTGIIAAPLAKLREWVDSLDNNNAQGEYYLTDIIALAVADGIAVDAVVVDDPNEVEGVNDRIQLAALERIYQTRQAEDLMLKGATLLDPSRIDIRGQVETGQDTIIDANVVFEGTVTLGKRVRVGPNAVIRDSVIGDDCEILPNSVLEGVELGQGVLIGPFARLRPGTQLADKAKIGNFVETKNSYIGVGSKVNHLSYVGDSDVGRNVNIGAGTITCNYDGANKHKTIIEDDVFVGSNTALVAPIQIRKGATVGAGTTIGKIDVAENSLIMSRAPTKKVAGWRRPVKKPK